MPEPRDPVDVITEALFGWTNVLGAEAGRAVLAALRAEYGTLGFDSADRGFHHVIPIPAPTPGGDDA